MYKVFFSRQAQKDAIKVKKSNFDKKCKEIIETLSKDPFSKHPPFEKLVGDLEGFYSRRLNIQHRIIYEVKDDNIVRVLRMWTHYE